MAVPVKEAGAGRTFEAGTPAVLFQTPLPVSRTQTPRDCRYDVAPDGRFLSSRRILRQCAGHRRRELGIRAREKIG